MLKFLTTPISETFLVRKKSFSNFHGVPGPDRGLDEAVLAFIRLVGPGKLDQPSSQTSSGFPVDEVVG